METQNPPSPAFPHRISSASGLRMELFSHGSIRRIDQGDIMINLFLGNEAGGSPANIHLRIHGGQMEWIPLLGPASPAATAGQTR